MVTERAVGVLLEVLARFPDPAPSGGGSGPAPRSRRSEKDRLPTSLREGRAPELLKLGGDGAAEVGKGGSGASWVAEYEQLHDILAVGQYALTTRRAYTQWIRQFQGFLGSAPPAGIDSAAAAAFLTHIAREKKVGASTQNQAFNALLFFFKNVLGLEFKPEGVERAKVTKYVPQTLTREEIDEITGLLPPPYRLLGRLMYGCGLRLAEALELRVHNFDFDLQILTIHRGKGQKDRTVPLPGVLIEDLQAHMGETREVFEADLAAGFSGAFMPMRGSAKRWDQRAKEWQWQFFFPAARLTSVKGGEELRRYHLHANRFSDLLRKAALEAGTHKKVSSHIFRHSFASHLVMANFDIKTVQEMMGHSDIRTTMIYLQTAT